MGLDGVEIVMETEETFGIEIPDAIAERLYTPGDLIEYVLSQLATTPSDSCLTQQLFYRLRRGFRRQLHGVGVTLDTEIRSVVSKSEWPDVWTAVRAEVGDPAWPQSIPWPSRVFRTKPATVRGIIWHIVGHLPKPAQGEPWTRARVVAEIRRIVSDGAGVERFQLRDRFVDDLGID